MSILNKIYKYAATAIEQLSSNRCPIADVGAATLLPTQMMSKL